MHEGGAGKPAALLQGEDVEMSADAVQNLVLGDVLIGGQGGRFGEEALRMAERPQEAHVLIRKRRLGKRRSGARISKGEGLTSIQDAVEQRRP